jgi:histidinol-phosphate/aromatic aminotransferase/cobyric acid decarboxylase-like protein
LEYYGVTAAPLTELRANTVCVRSLTAAFSIDTADAGFVLGAPAAVERIAQVHQGRVFTHALCRTVETVLSGDQAMARRLREVHEESLRVAQSLESCGIQCRLVPADFILLRVKDPNEFGNNLARHKVAIENLDGYPQMKNYLRYRVVSPLDNDRFIRSVRKMKPKCYRIKSRDARPATLRHAPEWSRPISLAGLSGPVAQRRLAEEDPGPSELIEETLDTERQSTTVLL